MPKSTHPFVGVLSKRAYTHPFVGGECLKTNARLAFAMIHTVDLVLSKRAAYLSTINCATTNPFLLRKLQYSYIVLQLALVAHRCIVRRGRS